MSHTGSAISRRPSFVILSAWMIWALLAAVEVTARYRWIGGQVAFSDALLAKLPLGLALAAITPGVLALSRRYPLLGTLRRRWDVHVMACAVLVAFIDLLSCVQYSWTAGVALDLGTPREYVLRVLGLWLLPIGFLYWFIVIIDHGLRHFVAARYQAEATARLEAQVAHSRLEALKLQLHPHFLFNALHSIGALVRTGRSADAVRVSANLGELLRRLLDEAAVQEVRLHDELALTRQYLDIESVRFSDRLEVQYDVAADTEDVLVPHFLLHPLVENALRHGLQPRARGGRLTIRSRRNDGRLELTVADNGVGLHDPGPGHREGHVGGRIGLKNTRARLTELYGSDQSLVLRDLGPGVEVRVDIPLREACSMTAACRP